MIPMAYYVMAFIKRYNLQDDVFVEFSRPDNRKTRAANRALNKFLQIYSGEKPLKYISYPEGHQTMIKFRKSIPFTGLKLL
jgi:hypothetical protein